MRILGLNLPDDKKVDYALTLFHGLGWSNVQKVLKEATVDGAKRVKDLSEEEVKKLVDVIEKNYKVEGDLREELNENVKRLREIGAYRGIRHVKGLPAKGQRTRSNARTKRGKRKTIGALKKEDRVKIDSQRPAAEPAK